MLFSLERQEPINVCPEQFRGTTFGYPLYDSGFVTENCDFAKNMSQLVTIIYDFVSVPEHLMSEQNITNVINQTLFTYPGVKLKIATTLKISSRPNLEIVPYSPHKAKVGFQKIKILLSILHTTAIRVLNFSIRGTKLERFLPKNQHTQRKFLNFKNWGASVACKNQSF